MKWLDLRGSGISVLERLLLEELLWRHNDDSTENWMLVGHHHEPTKHRYLRLPLNHTNNSNNEAVIVMGIGGKPANLLNLDRVRQDQVQTLKRFSGGGTVVLDPDSIWTTIIGRDDSIAVERFPRPIMEWSMGIFAPVLNELSNLARVKQPTSHGIGRKPTMVLDTRSCAFENTGRMITIPVTVSGHKRSAPSADSSLLSLALRENDYVFGEHKVAGNAQSIGKSGWLHHTCWLWDYQPEHMQYLQLPTKRPSYRQDRTHDDFLTTLQVQFPILKKTQFYTCLKQVVETQFDLEIVTLPTVMELVQTKGGGMQKWFGASRTKIVTDI